MTEGPAIGSHRFEGQSLQTMYSWMHEQGNGPGSAETARAALVQLGTLLSDVESEIRTALSGIGIEWEGAAAAAAGQAIRQSAQWVADAGRVSMTSCRPAADQGEAFTSARSQIQQPHSAEYGFGDAMADGFNIAGDVALGPFNPFEVQTDVDHVAKQNAANHAAAVQAMTSWNSAAQTNLAAMAPVDAPRPIAVEAAPATGAQQPAVGYGGSPASFGPAGGSGYSAAPSPVTAQHAASAAAPGPGPGAGTAPVSTPGAGSGGSPGPLLPAPATAPQAGPHGGGPGGRPAQPGSATTGLGPGPGPVATGGSERPRSGPSAGGGVPPAGRGGASAGRAGLPGGRGLAEGAAALPGPGGTARSGLGTAGPAGAAEGAGRAGSAATGGAGRGTGSFLHPAAAGARDGSGDGEHQNRYWQKDSGIFEDNRLVAPPVIGEDPQQ